MPGRRKEDSALTDEIYEASKLARQAQAEARASKADMLKKFDALGEKVERLKDEIAAKKIGDAMGTRQERRERWQSIGAALGKLAFYVVVIILNWDRAGVFFKEAFHKAAATQVPLMLDVNKKPAHRHHKRKPPPIITPEVKGPELKGEEHGESTGIE